MSLSKSKCCYSNNCLHFLKWAVPYLNRLLILTQNRLWTILGAQDEDQQLQLPQISTSTSSDMMVRDPESGITLSQQWDLFECRNMPMKGVPDLVEALVLVELQVAVVVKGVLFEEESDLVSML